MLSTSSNTSEEREDSLEHSQSLFDKIYLINVLPLTCKEMLQ